MAAVVGHHGGVREAKTTQDCVLRVTALAAALWLAGCASLQQTPSSETAAPVLPSTWTAPAPAGVSGEGDLAGWWARFGDPALAPLITQALQASPTLEAAQARLRQARAATTLAQAGLSPTLGSSGSAQASRREGDATSQTWRAGLDASWELDLWGAGAAGVQAATRSEQASALTLANARVSLAAEVANTVITLRGAQARRDIALRNLASQQQTLQIVQWRLEAGLVTQLDLAQAQTSVAQTAAQVPALEASIAQAMNALAVLTGQAPGALHGTLAAENVSPPVAPAGLALAFPADVLRQRPDVQAAERQLAAAAARVEQTDLGRLPSLSLGGSLGLTALSLSSLGTAPVAASLLASVNLPLFDGGRREAQVRQQEAARDEAAANWRGTVLGALQEVEDALVALASTQQQLQAQQTAAASARNAAELAEQRYRSGLVDFQSVLQSQRTQLSAEDALAAGTTSLATAYVRLHKALGGGWTPDTDSDTGTNTSSTR